MKILNCSHCGKEFEMNPQTYAKSYRKLKRHFYCLDCKFVTNAKGQRHYRLEPGTIAPDSFILDKFKD